MLYCAIHPQRENQKEIEEEREKQGTSFQATFLPDSIIREQFLAYEKHFHCIYR